MGESKESLINGNDNENETASEGMQAASAEATNSDSASELIPLAFLEQPVVDQPSQPKDENVQNIETPVKKPAPMIFVRNSWVEQAPEVILRPRKKLQATSRRDFLIYGVGMASAIASFGWLLPAEVKLRLGLASKDDPLKEKFLSQILKFDDAVGQKLFSKDRLVPTFSKSEMTEVPNNFAGQTPDPSFLPHWKLNVLGTSGGRYQPITSEYLLQNFVQYDQITRLVCVEGWSAISWWGGIRFADFIRAFPPKPDTKWIQLRSDVNLDGAGNPDPYFVSLDIDSAMHPQTLLATHHNGKPLELEHGAPLRLLAPMKLGLKNIKAITSISYQAAEPDDYWNKEGYSYYDGI